MCGGIGTPRGSFPDSPQMEGKASLASDVNYEDFLKAPYRIEGVPSLLVW